MSAGAVSTDIEEIAARLPPPATRRVLRAEARAAVLKRLPGQQLQIGAALFLAQLGQCFHCGGALPIFGHYTREDATTREHALPAGARSGAGHVVGACVLAHRLCNDERGERRLTRIEWQRAAETWARAHRLWVEAGGRGGLFPVWIELANHMQQETT